MIAQNVMTTSLRTLALALALIGAAPATEAIAQQYAVDVGANVLFPTPSTQYFAHCSVCGPPPITWNAVDANSQLATALVDTHAVSAGVTVRHVGGFGNFEANNAATAPGSDDERLIDDVQSVGFGANASTWTVSGLPVGPYSVVMYSWAPDNPLFKTALTVINGARGTQLCGQPMAPPYSYSYGVNYVRDYIWAVNGEISFMVEASVGFGSLNGFTIETGPCNFFDIYCTAKTNSLNCVPSIYTHENSSASATSGFTITSLRVLNNKPGLLLYGTTGRTEIPFQGGFLCVNAPVRRTSGVNSGGTAPPANDCSGAFAIDMNSFAAGLLGGNPQPDLRVPGTSVCVQWWGRDPGFSYPNNAQLTNAAQYFVCP